MIDEGSTVNAVALDERLIEFTASIEDHDYIRYVKLIGNKKTLSMQSNWFTWNLGYFDRNAGDVENAGRFGASRSKVFYRRTMLCSNWRCCNYTVSSRHERNNGQNFSWKSNGKSILLADRNPNYMIYHVEWHWSWQLENGIEHYSARAKLAVLQGQFKLAETIYLEQVNCIWTVDILKFFR